MSRQVQVDGANPEGAVFAAQPKVVCGAADEGQRRVDFRSTLKRGEREETALRQELPFAAVFAGWFRAELTSEATIAVSAVAPPRPQIDRILIGQVEASTEARIRIGEGMLAGTELRLEVGSTGAITAELLTASDGSREMLSLVMDELRVRLRGRGIALTVLDTPRFGNRTDDSDREELQG
jgi:hypothetical protein